MSTVKKRTTTKVDNEYKKEDKKKIRGLKKEMKKCDTQLRVFRKNISSLSFIKSTHLTDLDKSIDNFSDSSRNLFSLIDEILEPENWSKK